MIFSQIKVFSHVIPWQGLSWGR